MIPVTTAIQKKYILVKFLKLNDDKKKKIKRYSVRVKKLQCLSLQALHFYQSIDKVKF